MVVSAQTLDFFETRAAERILMFMVFSVEIKDE